MLFYAVLALTLDRDETAIVALGHDINAVVTAIAPRPLVPSVNFSKTVPGTSEP